MSRVSQLELYNDKDVITQILLMKEQVETGTYKEVRIIETGGNYVFEFVNQKDEVETYAVPAKQISGVTTSQSGSTVTMRVTYNDGTYQDVSWTAGGDVTTNTAQNITAVKTFTVSPIIPDTPSGTHAAVNLTYVSKTDGTNNMLHTSGAETAAGVKTFTDMINGHAVRGGNVPGTNNRFGWVKAAKFGVPVNYRNFTVTVMNDRYRVSSQFARLNIYCGSTPTLYMVDAYGRLAGAIDPSNYVVGIADGEVTLWYNKLYSDMGYWLNVEKSASYGTETNLPFTILNEDATDPLSDPDVTSASIAVNYDYRL